MVFLGWLFLLLGAGIFIWGLTEGSVNGRQYSTLIKIIGLVVAIPGLAILRSQGIFAD